MGQTLSLRNGLNKNNLYPDLDNESQFDPQYGFPEGRKERVMIATKEEMDAARLPHDKRDYCAHLAIEYMRCFREEWPVVVSCAPEKHHYLTCQFQDYELRMRDYERERRLLARAYRKRQKEAKENLE